MSIINRFPRLIHSLGLPQISSICAREEFSSILERELARGKRSGQVFSVVEFDIGDVETNRASGKQLLQALSKTLHSTDEVGWLDDHHIGVLLYNTTAERAQVFSKRFLELLPKVFIPPDFKIHTHPIGDQARDDSSYKGIKRRRTIQSSLFPQDATKEKTPEPVKQMRMLYSLAMPPGKRLIDIIGALVLLIIFSPFFLLVAFIIKIVSPEPVFFKQLRVVYGGKLFTLYKFRSMKVNADTSANKKYLAELIRETAGKKETRKPLKKPDDPQIMPFIGKVLRATCIDELPQLINVLLGDMSLVGPRPPNPY